MSTPVEFIEAIKALPPEERAEVVQFAVQYEAVRRLRPEELGSLGERLASTQDTEEARRLEKAIINGFYGA